MNKGEIVVYMGTKRSVSLPLWLCSPLDLGRFLSFLILYAVGRTPLTGDQPRRKAVTYTQTE
jgi:hypothetical protein